MDKVINLGIPHVGELIFEGINTAELLKFVLVSETWKVLAENVLIKRWKGKMYEAFKSGETKIVQLLLERCNAEESGLNIFVLIKRWKGKMSEACKKGETKIVKLLLERCDAEESGLNIKDEYGWTAFMEACYYGHKDVVKLLLEHSEKIDLNARDNCERTAFMIAWECGRKDVVKLFTGTFRKN